MIAAMIVCLSCLGKLGELVHILMLGCHQDRPFFIGLLLLHQHLSSWEAFVPAENMPNPFKFLLSNEDHEVAFALGGGVAAGLSGAGARVASQGQRGVELGLNGGLPAQ